MKILEIVVGMVLLTMFMAVISSYSRAATLMTQDARSNDAAYVAAEKKFTELSSKISPATTGKDTVVIDRRPYVRTWTIADSGYSKAEVIVTWTTLKGIKTSSFSKGI